MCGITGYIGGDVEKTLLTRLRRLEYRGYDSAGIGVIEGGKINIFKAKGEIKNLESKVTAARGVTVGIGHTRWATHGKPDEINAHPHVSGDGKWAVVHNGIIENYAEIKAELGKKGYKFYSETDTETVAKLLSYYGGDPLEAVYKTCCALKGSYALGIINSGRSCVYFAANKSPLYVAENGKRKMIASDPICFRDFSEEYYRVPDKTYGYVTEDGIYFYDELGEIRPEREKADFSGAAEPSECKHFMLKEIFETKSALKTALEFYKNSDKLASLPGKLKGISKIKLVGCGTAYHACLAGARMIESKTDFECSAYVASEFRYSDIRLGSDTLVVLVSQSGETADTLAALEAAKEKGAKTLAVVNVEYSTLARRADEYLPTKAGVETAVASTKAYSAQLLVLFILAEFLGAAAKNERADFSAAEEFAEKFGYGDLSSLKLLSEVLGGKDTLYMIGRGADYFTALEAALKIKETSYINTDVYYAGELKHGFLALIGEGTFVIAFATERRTLEKTLSNAEEARSRGAKIILFTCFDLDEKQTENFYYVMRVGEVGNELQMIANIVPWQLVAYYISVGKGLNPDRPKNLAKSVTVE